MNRHLNLLSLILLAALVLAAGALTGCGTRTGGSSSDESLQQAEDVPIRDDFDVSLTEADGKITVTIVNRSEGTAQLANAASGQLEILRDGIWYDVPVLPNRAATDEIYSVEPGASWDGVLTWDNYGDLEDGDYRMVWSIYVSSDSEEDSAASYLEARFSLKDGHVVAP